MKGGSYCILIQLNQFHELTSAGSESAFRTRCGVLSALFAVVTNRTRSVVHIVSCRGRGVGYKGGNHFQHIIVVNI